MNIRLTSELRAELQRLADEDGRKLSAYIERLLQLHVREDKDQIGAAQKEQRVRETVGKRSVE